MITVIVTVLASHFYSNDIVLTMIVGIVTIVVMVGLIDKVMVVAKLRTKPIFLTRDRFLLKTEYLPPLLPAARSVSHEEL